MRIQTFGGLRAWLGDDPLALPPSRQARALLACLAVAEKPLQRARLCELLWENSADPRGALRWCLSRLKAVVDSGGAARLAAEGDTLWIDPDAWDVDARQLRALARSIGDAETPALESAAARFAGPFLADLDLGDAIRFESWRVGEETSLARDRAAVFAEILRRHAESPEAKVRLGHLWVQQDPLDERPHAAILEALTALGRKREALAHYDRCAQMLKRHGNAPGAALEKARRDIGPLGQSVSAPPIAPAGVAAPRPPAQAHGNAQGTSRAPIAGRESEMERFRALAAAPDGRLRILAGEPGIGKTRLLEEMGEALEADGWLVLRGRAFEAERDRALGPWIDAARAAAARPDAGECPLLRPASLPERGLADQGALFEAMRAWLAGLAARSPLALILDDVHWLDGASVALLQCLLRGTDSPIRLALAGMRSVAAPAEPPVTPLLRLAQREGWSGTWDIGPLDAAGTASLLRAAGSVRDPGEVFARSAGHPLASLALAMDGDAAGPRATLDAMLDERIRVAGEDGRLVLQWSALLGRGLPPALLESLLDMPVHALLSALERLEAQGLMRVVEGEGGMEYLFGHDLIRQRSQDSLSAPRRARMHGHVASILRAQPALRRGWEEVAFHAEAGAQWQTAAEACLEAGVHCFRLRAFPAMVGFLEKGMDHLDRLGGHWALQREFCLLANRAVQNLRDYPEGVESRLARMAAKAQEAGQQETRLAALYALSVLRYTRSDPSGLREGIVDLDVSLTGNLEDPMARAFNLSGMALCLLATDQDIPKARGLLAEADRLCRLHGFEEADTRTGFGWLTHRDGRLDEAREHLVHARALMREKELPQFEFQIECSLARIELEEENPLGALEHVRAIKALDEVVRHSADRHFAQALTSLAKLQLGDPDAEALFLQSLDQLRADNVKVMTSYLQLMKAERELRSGSHGDLPERCAEAIARCESLQRRAEPAWARCLLGLSALAQGRKAEAESHWADLQAALKAPGVLPVRILGLAQELAGGLRLQLPDFR